MSNTYNLIIPRNVEEKIRYMLRKYPSTEWSGVLFCSHTGSFEDDNLEITCKDIFPMDVGNATYTEFNMSPDVTHYMAENMELFECDMQLVHSHHNMNTFFSYTDINTLREEGNNRNCFVSLIVNNAGTYSAAITRKVVTQSKITIEDIGQSYEFFGDGQVRKDSSSISTKVVDTPIIQYFEMNIIKEEVDNPFKYIDDRFNEIAKNKAAKFTKEINTPPSVIDDFLAKSDLKKDKQLYLWDQYDDFMEMPSLGYTPDPKAIDEAVAHLVTCSFILDTKKFDLQQWVTKHMKKVYKKIFLDDEAFNLWADFALDFIVIGFKDKNMPEGADGESIYTEAVAKAMCKKLEKYENSNKYISTYCETLRLYYNE